MIKNNQAIKFCKKCVTPDSRPRVVLILMEFAMLVTLLL